MNSKPSREPEAAHYETSLERRNKELARRAVAAGKPIRVEVVAGSSVPHRAWNEALATKRRQANGN